MRVVAVIGAGGFVGRSIAREVANSADCRLVPVLRGQNLAEAVRECGVVVHAANPAGRFQANRDPQRDYQETVEKTSQILDIAEGRKCILVSSLSCRTQASTPYGRNRLECERLALDAGAVVVRLGPMYGGTRVTLSMIFSLGVPSLLQSLPAMDTPTLLGRVQRCFSLLTSTQTLTKLERGIV